MFRVLVYNGQGWHVLFTVNIHNLSFNLLNWVKSNRRKRKRERANVGKRTMANYTLQTPPRVAHAIRLGQKKYHYKLYIAGFLFQILMWDGVEHARYTHYHSTS